MKTLSSIKLRTQKEDFSGARFILKMSVVLAAMFMLLEALRVPVL